MEMDIYTDAAIYISYAKIGMHNLDKSASEITLEQLQKQIDVVTKIYSPLEAIKKANKI